LTSSSAAQQGRKRFSFSRRGFLFAPELLMRLRCLLRRLIRRDVERREIERIKPRGGARGMTEPPSASASHRFRAIR